MFSGDSNMVVRARRHRRRAPRRLAPRARAPLPSNVTWTPGATSTRTARQVLTLTAAALLGLAVLLGTTTASAARATAQGTIGAERLSPPRVVSRAEWGARSARCSWDSAPTVTTVVVHHTTGADYDTPDQAMALLRTIQADHMDGEGWCDIGYNFLVDQWGTIYEGAAGSLRSAVIGAHARGFNSESVGIAMLGTFTDQPPTDAMVQAVGQVAGWQLGRYGVDPQGTSTRIAQPGQIRFPAGTEVTLPAIVGHSDIGITVCPGEAAQPLLPTIRAVAASVTDAMRASGQFGAVEPWAASAAGPERPVIHVAAVGLLAAGALAWLLARRARRARVSERYTSRA